MEVKPGYTRTEVGIIPIDWKCVESGDLADYRGGNAFKSADATSVGLRWLKIANVGKQCAQWNETSFLPESFASVFPNYLLSEGDVVMALTRPILDNELKIAKLTSADTPCLLNQRVAKVCARPNGVLDFLYYVLQTPHFVNSMNEAMAGSDPPNIGTKDLSKIFIAAPPAREEQHAIATALSDVDGLLGGLERLISKKRDLKQASMQQLLTGKTRLASFHCEWEVKRLGDLANLYQSETIGQSVFTPDGYPVYGANGIIGRYSRFNHSTPQITISCRGNCGTVNRTEQYSWITGNAMVVNLDKNPTLDHDFIFQLLRAQDFSILVTGSGQPQIVRGPLGDFRIALPPTKPEQTAIAEVLMEMDAELAALEQRREKTRALKQAMMQELLTGRTRLK